MYITMMYVPPTHSDLYIAEEQEILSHYNALTGVRLYTHAYTLLQVFSVSLSFCLQLITDWEIVRQDVMLEHRQLMHLYQESKTGLQAKLEAGIKFKKSTSKGEGELDFVPVNLHIQQMKVTAEETDNKGGPCCGCTPSFNYHS